MNSLNNINRESLFELALSKVSDAICMVTPDGDIVYANPQFCTEFCIKGLPYEGKYYDLSVPTPTKASFERKIQDIRANGGSLTYRGKYVSDIDNSVRYNQVSAIIMNTDQGEIVSFFTQDITELVKSRDDLRELNFLMDTILDNLPVYLFVKDVDNDLRYVYWNKAFAEYSKIPKERVIGRTDYEVFPSYEDAKKFRDDDMEVIANKEPVNTLETYEAANGKTRMVQTLKTICPREGRGPLLIGVSLDLTNMENIEQELVQERLRAEQSDRMKSSFLANMSHEIRTPLNAIVGFSNLLNEVDDPTARKQFVDIINQNSESLLQLINDILDISKIEAGTLEYIREHMDLGETFRNIYEYQKNRMRPGVELVLDIDPKYPHIIITEDRNRISQVVNNLINNAVKFTTLGEIRFGYRVEGDNINVWVSDTGDGISKENLDKVFGRFVKLNKFAQGTGLGLSICQLIVGLMNGQISVESELGKGSTFKFNIPYKKDKVLNQHIEDSNATEVSEEAPKVDQIFKTKHHRDTISTIHKSNADPNKRHTILVGEDTASNFLLLRTLLGKDYNLVWGRDGNEVIELYKECDPDLILMDVKMPGMDGLEATRLIRTYSDSVPIVALTAFAFKSDREKAFAVGMDDFLTKPLSIKDLNDILAKYLK